MSDFQLAKIWLAELFGIAKDAMHVCVGTAVFLLVALLLRLPLRDWRPFAAVLAVAAAGEVWDLLETWQAGELLRWDHSWRDFWLTALWPALLFALARWTRLLRR